MVLNSAKRSNNAGGPFWSCPNNSNYKNIRQSLAGGTAAPVLTMVCYRSPRSWFMALLYSVLTSHRIPAPPNPVSTVRNRSIAVAR